MADLQQPQTTGSISMTVALSPSGRQLRVSDASLLEEMARFPLDTLVPTGRLVRMGAKNERHVEAVCSVCKKTWHLYPSNVRLKKTTGCMCQRKVKYDNDPRATILGERYDAMLQRCRAPDNELYKNYGARGILLKFESREHFIRWMLEHCPHPTYREVQIDREDNDGHYEPGNLRLVTQKENLRNKRTNHWVDYFGKRVVLADVYIEIKKDYPYFTLARATVVQKLSRKIDPQTLIAVLRQGTVPLQTIQSRLDAMPTSTI